MDELDFEITDYGGGYFAAIEDKDQLGSELMQRVKEYYDELKSNGQFQLMRRSYLSYYGRSYNGSPATSHYVSRGGDIGELAFIKVNHFRNLGQHMLTLCTAQRPAAKPIASNTDAKSYKQTVLANGLLDYYSREKRVERILRKAAECSIAFGEGWVEVEWDSTAGDNYGFNPSTKMMEKEGDLRFSVKTPIDVIRDAYKEDADESLDWVITREFFNKYEMAAKYPLMKEEILSVQADSRDELRFALTGRVRKGNDIPVYKFYHKRSDAVPDGKMVIFCSERCVLFQGPLPYRHIPVRRIVPADIIGTPHGYTPMFDLLVIQEVIDALYSAVTTNQTSFGVQNIMVPDGYSLSFEQLATGLNLIKYGKDGKPEALNLTHTPQEIFNFIQQLEEVMETLSGINSTVRGNPEASLKSGSALALVQSQAIQFSSGLQQSFAALVEDVFTDAFNILKDYANTKRVATIVGKYNQYMLKSFVGSDLSEISRVVVDSGSALERTASGRVQIAQDLLNNKLIKTPDEYLSVINTGKLEPMTEAQTRELVNIRSENERLAVGRECRAMATDDHKLHIMEHKSVLDNPDVREMNPENDEIQSATMAHLMEHITMLETLPPNFLMMMGQQSLAVAPPPPEEAAGGTPAKADGSAPGAIPELPLVSPEVKPPVMPKNPTTGEDWNPVDGGDALQGAVAANNVGR